jgi:ATP-binding cassette subfamily B protein AbcA/BmrA
MNGYSINANNLNFDYDAKTKVFDEHSINLEVGSAQSNKLYGIIGPSGTGKTTLISILGGQLKPTHGDVLINGVNIYEVNDLVRRTLLGIQMQTSTSLRGKLKYNLLFGLPVQNFTEDKNDPEIIYTDQELIEVLDKVGLWVLFKDKDGLDTLIGEGGLNLSGGQRQRLNFAGLYLRAKYYKPKLLLIDEPTSSLDEISEQAITNMILDLAQDALTLVVAHRLKTLEEATGIMDTSLLESEKELGFYSKSELRSKSKYYQDLISGKTTLDGDWDENK